MPPLGGVVKADEATDVIPDGVPDKNETSPRLVQIGYRPLKGTIMRQISKFVDTLVDGSDGDNNGEKPPSPAYHWGVLVGGYHHELHIDSNWHVVYQNAVPKPADWKAFKVGTTSWNDIAIKDAGKQAIGQMRKTYNVYNNNCQTFVINVLKMICLPGRTLVTTSDSFLSGEKRGPAMGEEDDDLEVDEPVTEEKLEKMMAGAQSIMNENTKPLD